MPVVGAIPPPKVFDPELEFSLYGEDTIFRLITFYNDNFGIVREDNLDVRREKVRNFFFP